MIICMNFCVTLCLRLTLRLIVLTVICRCFIWAATWHTQAGSVQHCRAALAVFSKLALIMLTGQFLISWKAMYVCLHCGSVIRLPQCHCSGVILKPHWYAHHYSPLLYCFLRTYMTLFWIIRINCVKHFIIQATDTGCETERGPQLL